MNNRKNYLAVYPHIYRKQTVAAVAAIAVSVSSLFAQAPTSSIGDSLSGEDEVIELSPFEVRSDRDEGYFSRETLQAGRTSTELKDTPSAVTVLNKQFMEDIAATNMLEADIWSVNTEPTYNPGLSPTGSNHRGPNFSFFSRNYFLWYLNSDSFSAERFEFGRGPNGVLFGDGNIGGLASTMSKQAYIGRAQSIAVQARVDDWGGYRATADIHVPGGERFALRLNLLHDRSTMWQDHSDQRRDGAHLAGTVKLFKNTAFRFEGEVGKIDRNRYNVNYAEYSSYWDGTTFYDGVTKPASNAAAGLSQIFTGSAGLYYVDIPGDPGIGYLNWAKSYRTNGSGLAMRDEIRTDLPAGVAVPVLPRRDFNNLPVDSRQGIEYATSTLYLEHQFSDDFFAQVAYNSTRTPYEATNNEMALNQYYIDVNTVLPTGAANPNFGKVYSENYFQRTYQMNTVSEIRGFVAYRFDTGWWKSNINALAGSRFDKFDYSQRSLVQTAGEGAHPNLTNAANEYHFRMYWDDPVSYDDVPNIAGRTFEYARVRNLYIQRKFDDYAQLVSVNKFFKDRLTAIVGGRVDRIYQTQRKRISDDPTTGLPVLGATYIPEGETKARNVPGGLAVVDETGSNVNAGVVYYVRPWIGLYANYSETFATPDSGDNLIDGTQPGISHSESTEYGVKFNLMDGKIYADARYYDSTQTDMLTNTSAANQINRIWNRMSGTTNSNLAYRDTQSLILNGYEFEVTANPTRNLRLIANYALPRDQRNVDALPGLRAYYAEHIAEWKAAAAADAALPSPDTTIQTNIDQIDTTLTNNATLALVQRFTKYRANIYATYAFDGGMLSGFEVGGGANFVGASKVGNGASSFDYFWSDPYYLLSTHLSYSTKIFGTPVKFQLNVKNLLNESDPVVTGYTSYRVKGASANPITYLPGAYRYNDPRQIIFSASVKF